MTRLRFTRIALADAIPLIRRYWVVRNGVGYVPSSAQPGGVNLTYQVRQLRTKALKGDLSPELIADLESLPGWSRNPALLRTQHFLKLLRRHVQEHGWHGVIASTIIEGEPVGSWLCGTRHKRNIGPGISRWLANQLESIPGFSWEQSPEIALRRRLAALAKKHLEIIRASDRRTSRGRIGWRALNSSVSFFKRHRGDPRIPAEIVTTLEAIPGWSWQPHHDLETTFIRMLRSLARKHGGLPQLTSKTVLDGHRIGSWLLAVWQKHRKGRLPPDLARELESIPGWTWGETCDDRHRRKLAALKKFLETHELSDVHAARNFHGVNLRDWITGQRVHFREGRKQSEWLIRELEKIPDWSWNPRQEAPQISRRPKRRPSSE